MTTCADASEVPNPPRDPRRPDGRTGGLAATPDAETAANHSPLVHLLGTAGDSHPSLVRNGDRDQRRPPGFGTLLHSEHRGQRNVSTSSQVGREFRRSRPGSGVFPNSSARKRVAGCEVGAVDPVHDGNRAVPSLPLLQQQHRVSVVIESCQDSFPHEEKRMGVAPAHECGRQCRIKVRAFKPQCGHELCEQVRVERRGPLPTRSSRAHRS